MTFMATSRTRTVVAIAMFAVLLVGCGPDRPGPDTRPSGVLVLYDTTGPFGALGELYAIQAGNLASHFGAWTAAPVTRYRAGDAARHALTIYIGSTYDEPLPE